MLKTFPPKGEGLYPAPWKLIDIQEVVMIYSPTDAERKITERSAVQEKLWKIFELKKIEKQLSLHK